jgi:hypothetical protein
MLLFLCAIHIHHSKHTLFTLKPSVYISNYLNVTLRHRIVGTPGANDLAKAPGRDTTRYHRLRGP